MQTRRGRLAEAAAAAEDRQIRIHKTDENHHAPAPRDDGRHNGQRMQTFKEELREVDDQQACTYDVNYLEDSNSMPAITPAEDHQRYDQTAFVDNDGNPMFAAHDDEGFAEFLQEPVEEFPMGEYDDVGHYEYVSPGPIDATTYLAQPQFIDTGAPNNAAYAVNGSVRQRRNGFAGRTYACPECGGVFASYDELQCHVEPCVMKAMEAEVALFFRHTRLGRVYEPVPQRRTEPTGGARNCGASEGREAQPGIAVSSADDTDQEGSGENTEYAARELLNYFPEDLAEDTRLLTSDVGGFSLLVSVEHSMDDEDDVDETAPPQDALATAARMAPDMDAANDAQTHHNALPGSSSMRYEPVMAQGMPKILPEPLMVLEEPAGSNLKMDCPTCGLRLYRHNFSAHYRIHTGELPYPCRYCDKRFR
ncbi:MED7 protein [Aphelenchoides avenae]|nr:MED7 protein [Aphelenchus avenae]